MKDRRSKTITELLSRVKNAEPGALDDLTNVVYPELRRIAGALMAGEHPAHILQATALVNEFFLCVFGKEPPMFNDRRHFFLTAARAMRHILVEYARRQAADKRGGGVMPISLDEVMDGPASDGHDHLELALALDRLGALDERAAQIVDLRFYFGLTQEETAKVLDVSTVTVERDWEYARAWLHRALAGEGRPQQA